MSANLFTLKDARTECAPFVGPGGSCNVPLIDQKINEACRRLLAKPEADGPFTKQRVRVMLDRGCFPLPREAESVLAADVSGAPVHVFGPHYEFVQSGPGDLELNAFGTGEHNLIDAGFFPTMYDIPRIETDGVMNAGLQVVAFSTSRQDVGASIVLRGFDAQGKDVLATVTVNFWETEGVVTGLWSDKSLSSALASLVSVTKPITHGYVSLYAVDTTTNAIYFLAHIHPDDTTPRWRRYRVAMLGPDLEGTAPAAVSVLLLIKLAWLRMSRPTDVLPIQNIDAVRLMVMAIREEAAANLTSSQAFEAQAVRILREWKQSQQVSMGINAPQVIDVEAKLTPAYRMNRRICL